MTNPITLECHDCGATGDVLRVTAALRCRACGSDDLDLWEPKTAASPGTGWGKSRPDPASNWSDYVGPPASANPNITRKNDADDNHVCKVCGGTGTNPRSGGGGYSESVCRNCHGTGKVVYPTENDTPSLDAHMLNGSPLGAGSNGHYSKKKTSKSQAKVAVPGLKSNKVVTASQGDKIMAMASTIVANNSGLTTQEAFELARRAIVAFPEDGDK